MSIPHAITLDLPTDDLPNPFREEVSEIPTKKLTGAFQLTGGVFSPKTALRSSLRAARSCGI